MSIKCLHTLVNRRHRAKPAMIYVQLIRMCTGYSVFCRLFSPASHRSRMDKKWKKKRRRQKDEGAYICPTCGEQIVVPLDAAGGTEQQYIEDCPVCCNPNLIHLE